MKFRLNESWEIVSDKVTLESIYSKYPIILSEILTETKMYDETKIISLLQNWQLDSIPLINQNEFINYFLDFLNHNLDSRIRISFENNAIFTPKLFIGELIENNFDSRKEFVKHIAAKTWSSDSTISPVLSKVMKYKNIIPQKRYKLLIELLMKQWVSEEEAVLKIHHQAKIVDRIRKS